MKKLNKKKGFTLIEILVVIGLIAILAAVVLIAINPARQFAQARNSQRTSNVTAILNAIGQNMADNKGIFTCSGSEHTLPATSTAISNSAENIADCLVPTYLPSLPVDPKGASCVYTSNSNYNTCYTVFKDTNGRITISAPNTEIPPAASTTSVTR